MSEFGSGGEVPDFFDGSLPQDPSSEYLELGITPRRHTEFDSPPPEDFEVQIVAGPDRSGCGGIADSTAEAAGAEEEPGQSEPEPTDPGAEPEGEESRPAETAPPPDSKHPPQSETDNQPESSVSDAGGPPQPPAEYGGVISENPEEFGIQRFLSEVPLPEQVREAAARFDADTLAIFEKNYRYVDVLPLDEKFARLVLERSVPNQGTVHIGMDIEEGSGVRITDSGIVIPDEPVVAKEDPRQLFAHFKGPDGTWTDYVYFKDVEGNVRRREYNPGTILAKLPRDGTMPDKMVYRIQKQYSDEGRAFRLRMEQGLDIEHPLVGSAEMAYILEQAAKAEPSEVTFTRLRNIAVRRGMSRPPELEDSRRAGGRFIASVNRFLRDHGYDPARREAVSIKMSVFGSVSTDPESAKINTVMEVRAGKRRGVHGLKEHFVDIHADTFGTLKNLAEQSGAAERLQQQGIDLSGQGKISATLTYWLNQGRLASTLHEALVPVEGANGFVLVPKRTLVADTLEAREVRNFLRRPVV